MTEKPGVLLAIDLPRWAIDGLREHYHLHQETDGAARLRLPDAVRAGVRALVGNGTTEVGPALLEQLPNLGLVCMRGVGHEGVDLPAMAARGVLVSNGAGGNADTVADHAMALMLAARRGIVAADALVRAGGWRTADTARPVAYGKKLGILGMGDIGGRIARRAAGFGMELGYHNRREVPGSPHRYFGSVVAVADWADILMAVLPGGPGTHHLVAEPELEALGPGGLLVNVGRGSVVSNAALAAALNSGALGGAALDVVEDEPDVPRALLDAPNLLFTPHMAGRSPESARAGTALLMRNLEAFFAGQPLVTPVVTG